MNRDSQQVINNNFYYTAKNYFPKIKNKKILKLILLILMFKE